jgi:diguanylate cyclase (GGDEF)-like protein
MSEETKLRGRILIAEDDPISRRMLQAFLGKWGYDVEVAADGNEALAALEQPSAPQLAVLDWMMPGLEGPQVCEKVRQLSDRPYTYILLLTARGQQDDLVRGLAAGADDYLTKPFDSQELRARLRVGERILELERNLIAAREELRFRATHDVLTGIPNRAAVLEATQRECSRQLREGGTLSVMILDLDHFKTINDTYGHLCGDQVLREAARRIAASVRSYDTVGRYGGEEFLVVAPATDATGALALAERIRQSMEQPPINSDAGAIKTTVSCGVASNNCTRRVSATTLLKLADDALYRAKALGRNRCELADMAEVPAGAEQERVAAER